MKKTLFTIISLILSLFMCVSVMAGCDLITVDDERDMAQTVATIKVDEENGKEEIVTKQEIMMAFINNYNTYAYSMQYGTSQAEIFNNIIEGLVSKRIIVQYVMMDFNNKKPANEKLSGDEAWKVENYLTEEELEDAKYTTAKSINDLISSYMQDDSVNKKDKGTASVRTAPTNATKAEKEVDKTAYLNKFPQTAGIEVGLIGEERHVAYNKVIKLFENYGILGKEYKNTNNITDTDYYKDLVVGLAEDILIENFEKGLKASARKIQYSDLQAKYTEMYNAQINGNNGSSFGTAIEEATTVNPIVYSPYGGYGYVYNLLLGASETQTARVKTITTDYSNIEKDSDLYYQARNAIFSSLVAQDQRSTWITNGYDFDVNTNKFTGDYTLNKNNAFGYVGEVTELNPNRAEGEDAEYRAVSTKISLEDFIQRMENYLTDGVASKVEVTSSNDDPVYYYKKANLNGITDYKSKINELIFAFSTDEGSLNSYNGYTISPVVELGNTETFVTEFATAGRELIENKKDGYIIVASDFGYHVMFYSQALSADVNYETLEEYLNFVTGQNKTEQQWKEVFDAMMHNWEDYEDSDEYIDFLYQFASLYINESKKVSNEEGRILQKYRYDTKYVVLYENAYADLVG